jgi:hypothetical protein
MPEQFPDGVHKVPLVITDAEQIGTAVVKFENGEWKAELTLSSMAAANLGIDLAAICTSPQTGHVLELYAKPRADLDWINEMISRLPWDSKFVLDGNGRLTELED